MVAKIKLKPAAKIDELHSQVVFFFDSPFPHASPFESDTTHFRLSAQTEFSFLQVAPFLIGCGGLSERRKNGGRKLFRAYLSTVCLKQPTDILAISILILHFIEH